MQSAHEVDLDDVLSGCVAHVPKTASNYAVYERQFGAFLGNDASTGSDGKPGKDAYTDDNIAKFIYAKSVSSKFSPSTLKSAMAALGSEMSRYGLPNVYSFPHMYPHSIRVIKNWNTQLRIHPHVAKKAGAFTLEALSAILHLPYQDHHELSQLAFTVTCCFTALRAEDLHGCRRKMITFMPPARDDFRSLRFILERTKNDPAGKGPESGRTFLLPCTCMVQMPADEKKAFARELKKNPHIQCPSACPYSIVKLYLDASPSKATEEETAELPFCRALTARGHPRSLTCNPLGINEIYKAIPAVNSRLPQELQSANCTAHTGRNTLVTTVMNSGGDQIQTAAATKHKDPRSLAGYAKPATGLLMSAALHMAQGLPLEQQQHRYAGVELSEDGSSSSSNTTSAAPPAPLRNTELTSRRSTDTPTPTITTLHSLHPPVQEHTSSEHSRVVYTGAGGEQRTTMRVISSSKRGRAVPFSQVDSSSESSSESTEHSTNANETEKKEDYRRKKKHKGRNVVNLTFNF